MMAQTAGSGSVAEDEQICWTIQSMMLKKRISNGLKGESGKRNATKRASVIV